MPQRVLVAEKETRVGGAQDDGARLGAAVVFGEGAAAEDGDAERAEVAGGDGAPDHDAGGPGRERRFVFDSEREQRLRSRNPSRRKRVGEGSVSGDPARTASSFS